MYLSQLSLSNYRSYETAELALKPGVTVFVGNNGQGKTNLVEAVEYLATQSSHRVANDTALVKAGTDQAIVRGSVVAGLDDDRTLRLEIEINPGKSNRARLNRAPVTRFRDLIGILRCIAFTPDDLAIVKGDPADRRDFLDSVVLTRWPRMAGVKSDYERVLKQRNALLKGLSGRSHRQRSEYDETTLEVWNDQLVVLGAELLEARLDTFTELLPLAAELYLGIAPTNNVVSGSYRGTVEYTEPSRQSLEEGFRVGLAEKRHEEIARGVTLIGPHRDELALFIGDLPTKGYASHGESWSLALSLKLAAWQLIQQDHIEPVLILDDVFAELDVARRERLAELVGSAEQVLITAAVEADVPERLNGQRFRVVKGEVTPE